MSLVLLDSIPIAARSPVWPLRADTLVFRVGDRLVRPFGASAFLLGNRLTLGEDVDPFLDYCVAANIDNLRWFLGMYHVPRNRNRQPFLLSPTQVETVLTRLEARGFGSEVTTGDMQALMPNHDQQAAYFNSIDAVLQQFPSAHRETCNEPFKNGVDVEAIGAYAGTLTASGNYRLDDAVDKVKGRVDQSMPALLDYLTLHPVRKPDWPRTAKDAYEFFHGWNVLSTVKPYVGYRKVFPGVKPRPVWLNEGIGCAEVMDPWSRSNVPSDFFDYAACAKLFAAAMTAHGSDLITTIVPGPIQQTCIGAMHEGWAAVDDAAIFGDYVAGHHGDCPLEHSDSLALRTFGRIMGDRAEMVVIRPTPQWEPIIADPWRLRYRTGWSGDNRRNVLVLER